MSMYVPTRGTTVVAWELSRLTRKLTDLSGWVTLIEDHQLRVVTPQLDTGEGGLVLLTIMAALAHDESATKSNRVKDGKRRQRAKHRYMASRAPNGYRLDPKARGALLLDPAAAQVLRHAADLYLDNRLSLRAVATELNEAGMLTQRGNLWKASVLRRTFMNPLMAGFVILDDGTPGLCAGLTEGIVTAERWAELKQRINSRVPATTFRRPSTTLLSASGVLTCASCNGPMTPRRRKEQRYYVCRTRSQLGAVGCPSGVTINAEPVDEFAVLQCLHEIDLAMIEHGGGEPGRLDSILQQFAKAASAADIGTRADLMSARVEVTTRQEVIQDRYLAGKLTVDLSERGTTTIDAQLAAIDEQLSALPDKSDNTQLPVNPGPWLLALQEGEITRREVPSLFLKACGSLETARNVLVASLGVISVLPGGAGLKPVDRICYEAPQAI